MRALIIISAMVMTLTVSAIPVADASFFDETKGWWMDESQWQKFTEGGNDIGQDGNNLGLSGTGARGYAEYSSNWAFNMDETVVFSADFYYNPSSPQNRMKLGLIPTGVIDINGVSIGRGDELMGGSDKAVFYWEVDLGSGLTGDFELNPANSGTFLVSYDPGFKEITLSVAGLGLSKTYDLSDMIVSGQMMSVYLGGGSILGDTSPFNKSEVYFSNFQLTNGTPTAVPEPVSTTLFLLGGATLAMRKLRRK